MLNTIIIITWQRKNVLISVAVSIPTLYSCRHHDPNSKSFTLHMSYNANEEKHIQTCELKLSEIHVKLTKHFFYIIINEHYEGLLSLIISMIHILLLDSWFSGTPSDRIVSCALRLMETMRPNIDSALPEHVRLTLSRHKRLRGGSQEPTLA